MAKKPAKPAEPVPSGRIRIKMLTTIASPSVTGGPGSILLVPNEQADELIEGGYAELVESIAEDGPEGGSEAPGQE